MVGPLGRPFDGLRLCDSCTRKAAAMLCGRCGKLRPPARRNDNGHPICQACWWRDPRSWKPCTSCGEQRRVAAITEAGPWVLTAEDGGRGGFERLHATSDPADDPLQVSAGAGPAS